MVSTCTVSSERTKLCFTQNRQYPILTREKNQTQINHHETWGFSIVRKCIISAGLPENTADIIMHSWRSTTAKQYGSYFKKWVLFCDKSKIDQINPSLGDIVAFLQELHDGGLSYSAINTAKSMLSSLFEIIHKREIGREVLIKRFMKGIFHLRPVIPKTIFTWDVKVVLKFLKTLDNTQLTLRLLSIKLALLLILTTGQRCQTLHAMNIKNIEIAENSIKIRIGELLKQTKPNQHLAELYIEAYSDPNICVVEVLKSYLHKTENIRSDSSLFIITQKPYSAASKSTIANWIKLGLKLSGIDMRLFTPHSTRSASTSALVNKVSIDTITKTAGWAKDCTFRKFYKRPITNDSSFSYNILH